MHTTIVTLEDGREYTVLHNGDFSGDVDILAPAEKVAVMHDRTDNRVSVTLPFAVLESIVGSAIIADRISQLEQVEPVQFIRRLRNER